jgi:hypothetical protein
MNPLGNEMMALGVLRAFGLNNAQIEKAESAWLDIPQSSAVDARAMITLKQYKQLNQMARERHVSLNWLINELFNQTVSNTVGK